MLFRRSMRWVLLLSAVYAAASNVFLYSAYFYNGIVEQSYIICAVMIVAFALPIVKLFRNRHWYFPTFIFLFWIPFSVLLAYVLSLVLPMTNSAVDFGLLLVYCLILNVIVMVLGIGLGMLANASWLLWKKWNRPKNV